MNQFEEKQLHKQIPLQEHLSWKITSIVEVLEGWRIIHQLLSQRHSAAQIKGLFPAMDDDYFNVITNYFAQYGVVDSELVLESLLVDYRKKELEIILERMMKHEEFNLDDIEQVIPVDFKEELLSLEKGFE